ncbi:MAG: hypothetical protein KBT39_07165 [Bacteroidales bacterium]|nr:hypothetical protein [Bacteroidales bacterium]
MKKITCLPLLVFIFSLCTSSCSDDNEVYPSIVTKMADIYTNAQGDLKKLVFDDERSLTISNYLPGYQKDAIYRALCGYTSDGHFARLYQLMGVNILRDSTTIAWRDPLNTVSVWRTKRYINLHLSPKTQGGRHYWGFITDSIITSTKADGQTSSHAYISLHHKQNGDPTSYSEDVYASLPVDSIKGIEATSPITLRIQTFDGIRAFEL